MEKHPWLRPQPPRSHRAPKSGHTEVPGRQFPPTQKAMIPMLVLATAVTVPLWAVPLMAGRNSLPAGPRAPITSPSYPVILVSVLLSIALPPAISIRLTFTNTCDHALTSPLTGCSCNVLVPTRLARSLNSGIGPFFPGPFKQNGECLSCPLGISKIMGLPSQDFQPAIGDANRGWLMDLCY